MAVWFVGVLVVALPFATKLVTSAEHATVLPGTAAASLTAGVECVGKGQTPSLCHFASSGVE
ncbi:MAG: hypothetical protein AAF928_16610 [Myxococcota bacterium]